MSQARKPLELDASDHSRRAHFYDEWARKDLEHALVEADDPATEWIDHEEAMAELTAIVAKAQA